MRKRKSKLAMFLSFLGVVIFVAMGLGLAVGYNKIMIFAGIVCFLLAGLVERACGSGECNELDDCSKK